MSMSDPYGQQQPPQSQPPQMAPPGYQQQMPAAPPYQPYATGPEINGKAVAALVCGMIFVTSPLGLMGLFMGRTAERQIDAGMGIGRPIAKAGRVLGWVSLGFTIFWALYIVIAIIAGLSFAASAT